MVGHQNHETVSKKVFDDFVRLPFTIFITRSTNKVWKYKKEYKNIDIYTFHPKKDALPILQECPNLIKLTKTLTIFFQY